jgi:hypothetical protein
VVCLLTPIPAADFDLLHNTLRTVATRGTSPIGNYLLLLYFLGILEDDYKRTEEKRAQFRQPGGEDASGKSTADINTDTNADDDEYMEIEISIFILFFFLSFFFFLYIINILTEISHNFF